MPLKLTGAIVLLLLVACGSTEAEPSPPVSGTGNPAGAAPGADTTSTPASPARASPPAGPAGPTALTTAEDFIFEWRQEGGPAFIDQLSIRGDGQMIWVASSGGGLPHVLETRLPAPDVSRVRQALEDARFFDLDEEYRDPAVEDGTRMTLRVRAGGQTHRVTCENRFPQEVSRIRSTVEALLTDDRRAALAAAPEAQPEDFDPSLVVTD